jgi:hypothetical protein
MTTAQDDTPEASPASPAVGIRLDRSVGRLVPERRECDAPICPWCDRQGWATCGSHYDTYTCEARL